MSKLSFTITKANANLAGEVLRREFFKTDTWDFRDDVRELSGHNIHDGIHCSDGMKEIAGTNYHCEWYWDGDYFLAFEWDVDENSFSLINYDAKKEYGWEYKVNFASGN